jgi:hypothetical protein
VYLQDIIIIEKEELIQVKAQVQDEQLEENICLKFAIYIVTMDM